MRIASIKLVGAIFVPKIKEAKFMSREDLKDKRFAMTAAEQLGYGDDVVLRIKASHDLREIDRIMTTARKNMKWE